MSYWHVTTSKKLAKYQRTGFIAPPVRAWKTPEHAIRMSLSSGRRIILRLSSRGRWSKLEGHYGQAVVTQQPVYLTSI